MKKRLFFSLIAAVFVTALVSSGILYPLDNTASDALYQRTGSFDRDIIVVEIDQETVDSLGTVSGYRGAMAEVIDYLTSDPDNRPAVIGIDFMYTGSDPENMKGSAHLCEACRKAGNVVVAAEAVFGDEYTLSDRNRLVKEYTLKRWYGPYDELKEVTEFGHINQNLDLDGIFRHARMNLYSENYGTKESFAGVIYRKWCRYKGIEPGEEPKTDSRGFFYLRFSADEKGFYDGVNFLDLYTRSVDPAFFAGRIVLIGVTYAGSQDDYFTSLDHSRKIPGVVIQANIIEALKISSFAVEPSETIQTMILFMVCFAVAFLLWKKGAVWSFLIFAVTVIIWLALCLIAYQGFDTVFHVLKIPAAVFILYLISAAYNYMQSQEEKRAITDTFGHYIDPAVMDELLRQGKDALELGGKNREIAVLFVDIRGFTSMSEVLEPGTVVEILNRYLTVTTECIIRNHGTLDKFVGDCTMAIWNAPVDQEDPVYLACRAAMDMKEASDKLGEELLKEYGRTVSFGIGINYGPAVVGNIGAPKRLDYTAIGDTVNTAARLEENAGGGKILISRTVADALGEKAEVKSLGDTIKLKGKTDGFEVLELLVLK